jgi:hypothetical protein
MLELFDHEVAVVDLALPAKPRRFYRRRSSLLAADLDAIESSSRFNRCKHADVRRILLLHSEDYSSIVRA